MKASKMISKRTSTITMDTEARLLSLVIVNVYQDGGSDEFRQDFNMNVMPYDMAMSVICSLINPQRREK